VKPEKNTSLNNLYICTLTGRELRYVWGVFICFLFYRQIIQLNVSKKKKKKKMLKKVHSIL